jgi:hypothetical protein
VLTNHFVRLLSSHSRYAIGVRIWSRIAALNIVGLTLEPLRGWIWVDQTSDGWNDGRTMRDYLEGHYRKQEKVR